MTAAIYFVSLLVCFPHSNRDWPMLITSRIGRFGAQSVVEVLYHVLPRTYEFGQIVTNLILERPIDSWVPVGTTLLSGGGALLVAILLFRRTDF